MRYARLKPNDTDTFMHVYNRIAGTRLDRPFDPVAKTEFIHRLFKLAELYVIEIIAYQLMGNHFHLLVHIPATHPSPEETCARFNRFYPHKQPLTPDSPACTRLAPQLRDISLFMRDLQQSFTRWFNRTRPVRRKGHLWGDRFKNTVLEDGRAVWSCWKYIEMNPVRAGIVHSPANYRFCSFGAWSGSGQHPFAEVVEQRLLPRLRGLLQIQSLEDVRQALRIEFARVQAQESGQRPSAVDTAGADAAKKEPFTTQLDRRVRYWVDGLAIGSELFVRNTMSKVRVAAKVQKRHLVRLWTPPNVAPQDLVCFKQLRVLRE